LSAPPPPKPTQGEAAGTTGTDHGRGAARPPGALRRELASAAPGGRDDAPQPQPPRNPGPPERRLPAPAIGCQPDRAADAPLGASAAP
jgi:hypothetical protein